MRRLLAIASWWCGERTKASVFEPLLADWQHELEAARAEGRPRYAAALVSGAFAYTRSLARCTMSGGGWLPTSRAAQIAALTFFFTLDAAFFVVWIAAIASGTATDPGGEQTKYFLLSAAGVAVPPILLPALFLMRRDARSTVRHAISTIAVGATFTAGVVTLTTPERLNAYFSTFESYERRYQQTLANDQAGRVTYPGTAVRELSGPTTIEQRRAQHKQFMAWRAGQEATRAPLRWQQQLRRYRPVALTVSFGMIGWMLAGLGAASFTRAALWWCLMYAALFAFGAKPMTIGLPSIGRIPDAMALPFFGAVAFALVIASWHRHQVPRPGHEAQGPRH